jgi:hypothetical protein
MDEELVTAIEEYPAVLRSVVVSAVGTCSPSLRCDAPHPQPAKAAARRTTAANTSRFDRNIAPPHPANSDLKRLQLIITRSGHWPIFTRN